MRAQKNEEDMEKRRRSPVRSSSNRSLNASIQSIHLKQNLSENAHGRARQQHIYLPAYTYYISNSIFYIRLCKCVCLQFVSSSVMVVVVVVAVVVFIVVVVVTIIIIIVSFTSHGYCPYLSFKFL